MSKAALVSTLPTHECRQAFVDVAPELLLALLKLPLGGERVGDMLIQFDGLEIPADAKVVRCDVKDSRTIRLTMESKELPPVASRCFIPELEIAYKSQPVAETNAADPYAACKTCAPGGDCDCDGCPHEPKPWAKP